MGNEISRNNKKGIFAGVNPIMATGSSFLIILFVIYTTLAPEHASGVYSASKNYIATNLAWYYVGLMSIFLFISIYLVFSRYGSIKLGKPDVKGATK
ncbi:BCCT family transporter [Enterovibrio makurazakiensis]|uniref:BCCT family transporter n=1 Tax=Enterovibrio makurazakiensis TaxID=2910232 RepID=UPI003D1B13CB